MFICDAEEAGFEPAVAIHHTIFPGLHHRPLGHSSIKVLHLLYCGYSAALSLFEYSCQRVLELAGARRGRGSNPQPVSRRLFSRQFPSQFGSPPKGVELVGLEPTTPCVQSRCATICATAPHNEETVFTEEENRTDTRARTEDLFRVEEVLYQLSYICKLLHILLSE